MASRAQIAAYAASAIAIWSSLELYQRVRADPLDVYNFAKFVERAEPAAAMLPKSAPSGYLSDAGLDELKGQILYHSSLYTAAPRMMRNSAKSNAGQEFVVGNFSILDWGRIVRPYGLETFKDFGNGVALLRAAK
ncbi:MAG: hypothetical protein R2729_17885 [Bryobacteraceae bacterium]